MVPSISVTRGKEQSMLIVAIARALEKGAFFHAVRKAGMQGEKAVEDENMYMCMC
jgi:hypothetical protein